MTYQLANAITARHIQRYAEASRYIQEWKAAQDEAREYLRQALNEERDLICPSQQGGFMVARYENGNVVIEPVPQQEETQ